MQAPEGTTELGIDIIKVDRIRRALERFGSRFPRRILTDAERAYVRDRPENLAGRWAAKEAVSKALAMESAKKGITVNVVAPGYIGTEMVAAVPEKVMESIVAGIPVGRLGEAEEIAACVAFLVRDDASFITGMTLGANGGQYMVG